MPVAGKLRVGLMDDESGVKWRVLYALVLGELALLVGLFYALTRWAS